MKSKYSLNIRSFNKNINTFNIFLDTLVSKPDIIVLTETWLTDTDDPSIYLTDYKMFKTNRILKIKKKVEELQFLLTNI